MKLEWNETQIKLKSIVINWHKIEMKLEWNKTQIK